MAIIKCKMCGGDIELTADKTFGTCEFCGSIMTFPKVDDDQRAAAFNRGNHFRRIGEFDKALAVYERIVREDDTDAEAHWCCALCRFGIEYVEDPATYEYLPTCHRASFDSFLEDVDYLAAVEHSDGVTKRQYQKDAAKIAEVQRGILATSQNAEPYDVFICYKESDENGDRTRDSLLAQDIYYQLVEQGRKVFFARITLEDVAGAQYEPYIFAALNSAKVMIVVGTKPEYLNAVWVKNEWSRFLVMMKKDRHKLLLPCYRDMDPYDMPEALSVLQSYDMAKIGFIQDLTRGIAKVLDADKKPEPAKETVVVQQTAGADIAPLLKRVFMFLEDGDWNSANEYCEKVLDMDPENAQAYLGKLMAELRVRKQENLKDCAKPFNGSGNYQKTLRFGDEKLKAELTGYIEYINTRNENARLEGIYTRGKNAMSAANTETAFKEAAQIFETIPKYKDAATLAKECYEKAEIARKEAIYQAGKDCVQSANRASKAKDVPGWYEKAAAEFEKLGDYMDAAELTQECHKLAENATKDAILADAKWAMDGASIRCYEEAIKLLETIPGWKDADERIVVCNDGIKRIEAEREQMRKEEARIAKRKKMITAIITFAIFAGAVFFLILSTVIIPTGKYNDAVALMDAAKYEEALAAFEELHGYKDSAEKARQAHMNSIKEVIKNIKVGEYIKFGSYEQDNNKSNGKEDVEWLVLEVKDGKVLVISKYALHCEEYNNDRTNVTWETCSLRKWLNNSFIISAFSKYEQAMIPSVTVSANNNPEYSTNPGQATKDQVFVLSIEEVNKYFASDVARQCKATAFATATGAYVNDSLGTCWWWLRSPNGSSQRAAGVQSTGRVVNDVYVNIIDYSVRPAMWIDPSLVESN